MLDYLIGTISLKLAVIFLLISSIVENKQLLIACHYWINMTERLRVSACVFFLDM